MKTCLKDVMTISGKTASVRYGDLSWNGYLLDLVDWNEMASREADSILEEAFGSRPDRETMGQYFETYWCGVIQPQWLPIPGDTVIEVEVVRDSDGEIDMYDTIDRLDDAVAQFVTENTCLTDEQREAEIERLREAYPEFVS